MPDPVVDLNTVALSGTLTKMPDFASPWSYLELKLLRETTSVLFVSLHVRTDDYLRLLEDLSPGDRLYVTGELAYVKAPGLASGGQTCVKVTTLQRLDPAGRLGAQAWLPTPVPHQATPIAPASGRQRRHRKRRSRPEGQR